jgi:hypothetical protein
LPGETSSHCRRRQCEDPVVPRRRRPRPQLQPERERGCRGAPCRGCRAQ